MKRWYVVQIYAGYEEAVKIDLSKRIIEEGVEELFGDILVPSVKAKKVFSAEEEKDQQLFPGYLLIEMEAVPEAIRLVNVVPRVLKFLGGREPVALSKKEVDRILAQIKGDVVVPTTKSDFVIGGEIEIKEGPFAGFVGIIEKVDDESERLTVMVSIFGRLTPVELGFSQIKQ